jgi:glycosyltransferase involved in cell wall biosynthesis
MFCDEPGHAKGGEYIIQLAKQLKNVQFFVAGESKITGEIPENMILLGKIQDQKLLAEYYSMADVTLITSKRETFSMPCAESLCCGTPVAGFRAGGPEQIALKEYSTFVEYGDTEALLRSTKKWLYEEKRQTKMISQQAKELYSKEKMASQYMDLYRGLLND